MPPCRAAEGLFSGWSTTAASPLSLATCDDGMVQEILSDLRKGGPADAGRVVEPVSSFASLRAMGCRNRHATRYHNVMCALKLHKPTISLGYGEEQRHDGGYGLAGFTQPGARWTPSGCRNSSGSWRSIRHSSGGRSRTAARSPSSVPISSSPRCQPCSSRPAGRRGPGRSANHSRKQLSARGKGRPDK